MAEAKPSPIAFIHFVDVESVSELDKPDFEQHKDMWDIFTKRFQNKSGLRPIVRDHFWQDYYEQTAGLYAEHGKIVCISIGKMHTDGKFYVKSFCGKDEKKILIDFAEAIANAVMLCAHNGKEFDFPFLFRRYIINGLAIPHILNTMGKKPWEVPLEDTMQLWGATQWNYKVSLALLAHILGLPSPKQEMDGSDVGKLYYSIFSEPLPEGVLPWEREEQVFEKIGTYCGGDVVTLANVFCRLKGYDLIAVIVYLKSEPKKDESAGKWGYNY